MFVSISIDKMDAFAYDAVPEMCDDVDLLPDLTNRCIVAALDLEQEKNKEHSKQQQNNFKSKIYQQN